MKCDDIREAGLRMTPQREAILDALHSGRTHPSAEGIFEAVRSRYRSLSLATVYNTLDALKRRGMVRELVVGQGQRRYDAFMEPHDHAVCKSCGKVFDIPRGRAAKLILPEGFEADASPLTVFGRCGQCG